MSTMNFDKLEIHSNWIKELHRQKVEYNYAAVVSGANIDMTTSRTCSMMGRMLLIFTFAEQGHLREASRHLEEAFREIDSNYEQSGTAGKRYLLNGLRAYLCRQKGLLQEESKCLEELPDLQKLDELEQAVVFGNKGYSCSRWEPFYFCRLMVESSKKAVDLAPKEPSFRFGYAVVLGRQRRQLRSILSPFERSERIKEELDIFETFKGSPDGNHALCFSAFLYCELAATFKVIIWKYNRRGLWEKVNQNNMKAFECLEKLHSSLSSISFDKYTIMKRMAMCYSRLGNIPKFKHSNLCVERALEVYATAEELVEKRFPAGNDIIYRQIGFEQGRLLRSQKRFKEAEEILDECWRKVAFPEALILYIRCKQERCKSSYDPLLDVSEGICTTISTQFKVYLLCIRGEFLKEKGNVQDCVGSLMDALKLDPWGKFMKDVWVYDNKPNKNCQDELLNLLKLCKRTSANPVEVSFYCRKLAQYFKTKRPQNIVQARNALKSALSIAKEQGCTDEEKEIEQEITELVASENEAQDFESVFLKNFDKECEIGRGAFGVVFKVKHKVDWKLYAVKAVFGDEDSKKEASVLSDCDHKNVIRYYSSWLETPPTAWTEDILGLTNHRGYWDDLSASFESKMSVSGSSSGVESDFAVDNYVNTPHCVLFIHMELCKESLDKWLGESTNGLTLDMIHVIFKDCLDALQYIHKQKYIHKDLKPNNIFLNWEGEKVTAKIGDFGLAKSVNGNTLLNSSSLAGPKYYKAPELNRKGDDFDERIDVYALGMILFQMLCKSLKVQGPKHKLFSDARELRFPVELKDYCSRDCSILVDMLAEDFKQRPTAAVIQKKIKRGVYQ